MQTNKPPHERTDVFLIRPDSNRAVQPQELEISDSRRKGVILSE